MNLTDAEKATNHETWTHIHNVQRLLLHMSSLLSERCLTHDQSKLSPPEVSVFTEYTKRLKDITYGSDEYKQCLREMQPALDNHYACNRHHPEHFENGIDGMTLIDLLEMICDWYAATARHADGDIMRSLEHNEERFKISPQLMSILMNTVSILPPHGK